MKFLVPLSLFSLLVILSGGCSRDLHEETTRVFFLNQSLKDQYIGRYFYNRETTSRDSFSHEFQQIEFPGNGRILSKIFTKDIVLGRNDSVRIGIIHPLEKVYGYPKTITLADQLILTPYGQDTIPISLDQENVGPVTRSTVFRINRNYYSLNSLDSTRQRIELGTLERRPRSQPTAAIDTRFKGIAVRPLAAGDTTEVRVQKEPGKATLIYFWSIAREGDLEELSERIAEMGEAAPLVIAVSRTDSKANLLDFSSRHPNLSFPLYQATASTCNGLQCHPGISHAMVINSEGRILTHYRQHRDLLRHLQ
ncbi:hypothetical protein CEQ90_17415 [Lewinellaceae bacterium SD302]|nr:hypothetical protein CEQ90_17415 [Lewinellaceae bacterium SD302]